MHAPGIESEVRAIVPVGRAARVLAWLLVSAFTVLVAALALVPWQQTAPGTGRVTAYAPVDRQHTIDAPIDGRVVKWHVHEGERVERGQPLVDISDNDPQFLERMRMERDAVQARIDAARARVAAIGQRMEALRSAQRSASAAADQRAAMGRERFTGTQHALEATEAASKAAAANLERQRSLFARGLTSARAVELAEADEVRARTEVDRAQATLAAARAEVTALSADRLKVTDDADAAVSDALAAQATAQAEIANGEVELARLDVRMARQQTQHVVAPARGTVLRVLARQGGEMVKTGEALASFVPETADRAVELSVAGNDVNLLNKGQPVRLQFEGWPAVQFSGWPSAAIGTYGGKVAFIDPMDDGHGKFRVVIVPDGVHRWPAPEHLRQGTRVYGWVLLERVTLGYELWRQFNGFPPEWTGAEANDRGAKRGAGEPAAAEKAP